MFELHVLLVVTILHRDYAFLDEVVAEAVEKKVNRVVDSHQMNALGHFFDSHLDSSVQEWRGVLQEFQKTTAVLSLLFGELGEELMRQGFGALEHLSLGGKFHEGETPLIQISLLLPLDHDQVNRVVFSEKAHHLQNHLLQQFVFLFELQVKKHENGPPLEDKGFPYLAPHFLIVDESNELVEVFLLDQVHILSDHVIGVFIGL